MDFSVFKNGLIVSCQAESHEPLHGPHHMARMAVAAETGGAKGLRINTPEDVAAVRAVTKLPIIGLFKDRGNDYEAFITTKREQAEALIKAGADIVAIDCTMVTRPEPLEILFQYIRDNYPEVGILADIASLEDAVEVAKLKPDFISTTLSGYTKYTLDRPKPDLELVREIQKRTDIPVVAEGNYGTPEEVRKALLAGAYSVIVGGAITRPQNITKKFTDAISDLKKDNFEAIGIDIGGTWIRGVVIDRFGTILKETKIQNQSQQGRDAIFNVIKKTIDELMEPGITQIGIATAGNVDFKTGKIIFASDNLIGWTGFELGKEIEKKYNIKTIVDNDANCATYAQWKLYDPEIDSMLYMTLGTGLGSGIIANGELVRGKLGRGGEIGHLTVPNNHNKCKCGKYGCLETVLSGKLMGSELNKENYDDRLNEFAYYTAWIIDTIKNINDVEKVYIGGIASKYGEKFLGMIKNNIKELSGGIYSEDIVEYSSVGELAGAVGAALCAFDTVR